MNYPKLAQFSQVKTSIAQQNTLKLFTKFRFGHLVKASGITKEKGYAPMDMLLMMLLMILENSRSIYSGIISLQKDKLKTPINNMLNNEQYNWRNLLYMVAGVFTKLCPAHDGGIPVLIIDDTAKAKTGRKGENIAWFVDHCKKAYYMGFQVVMAVWSNGVTAIPIDFEIKIGKSKTKHAARTHYPHGTHTDKRERKGKQKKIIIALAFIKRSLQRRYDFRYVLWDSWYNCTASLRYTFEILQPKGIHLISMLKRDKQRYQFQSNYLTVKEIYRQVGKWHNQADTGIRYKSGIVTILDKKPKINPENQLHLGTVRMCFYRYPNHKDFKVIISTNTELSEMEILSLYLRRWAVEVVFKDLKQYFGFDQSKSSKYAPQIADLTIRCVFYIMFCSLRYSQPDKSTDQLIIEFYNEMQENWLDIFCRIIFQSKTKSFLCFALQNGYREITQLLNDFEDMMMKFFDEQWCDDKIEEVDNGNLSQYRYRKAN